MKMGEQLRKSVKNYLWYPTTTSSCKCRGVSFSKGTERRPSRNKRLKKILRLEVRLYSYTNVKFILLLSITDKSYVALTKQYFPSRLHTHTNYVR